MAGTQSFLHLWCENCFNSNHWSRWSGNFAECFGRKTVVENSIMSRSFEDIQSDRFRYFKILQKIKNFLILKQFILYAQRKRDIWVLYISNYMLALPNGDVVVLSNLTTVSKEHSRSRCSMQRRRFVCLKKNQIYYQKAKFVSKRKLMLNR